MKKQSCECDVFLTQIRILNDIKCRICVFHTPRFSPDAKFL